METDGVHSRLRPGRENHAPGLYDSPMKAAVKRARGRPKHADLLTPSEWRTVHAVQHGLSNAEIARRRGVSVDAVKYHVANALAKLGLPDRKALRAWFRAPRDGALAAQLAEPRASP